MTFPANIWLNDFTKHLADLRQTLEPFKEHSHTKTGGAFGIVANTVFRRPNRPGNVYVSKWNALIDKFPQKQPAHNGARPFVVVYIFDVGDVTAVLWQIIFDERQTPNVFAGRRRRFCNA